MALEAMIITVILKVHKIRVLFFLPTKTRKNVTVLRLTEVTVLMSNDLYICSQTPPSLPSSPPYEGICGIMAANAGAAPTQIGSKPTTLLLC